MDTLPDAPVPALEWSHVGVGLTFVALGAVVSQALQLRIGSSLVFAALRCTVQLTVVATILQHVFATKNWWSVAGIAVVLNTLGTLETVVVRAGRKCQNMFSTVLFAMLVSTIPVAIVGVHYAMRVTPFWTPEQFIPVVGMLCGNAIAAVMVAQSYILKELDENRDKTETLLAFGASRFEACLPLAVETIRLAMMPTINAMSVLGIIAIPGMMTGAILGGADVQQAARLQMIIMFMISASSALACITATLFTLYECVDSDHRIRDDRIFMHPHTLQRVSDGTVRVIISTVWAIPGLIRRAWILVAKQMLREEETVSGGNSHDRRVDSRSERSPLLP